MMDELKRNALTSVDAGAEFYKSIADAIWEQPELSLKECLGGIILCKAAGAGL